ncbi:Uncharacterised protein [Vibrio cholerae]|nr:Uncharacterised protein [Vibrio cholerae]CSC96038.1 Uncharacterised protein [Vibrio cholerae]CSI31816.1 Uncharacterised protein [Vibrio cholerae]
MVSHQLVVTHQRLYCIKKAFELRRVIHISRLITQLFVHLRQCGCAKTILTIPQVNQD